MNVKLALESVFTAILVVVALVTGVMIIAGIFAGFTYLGIPVLPAIAITAIFVLGVMVGVSHYFDNV